MSKARGITASEKLLSRIPGSDALPGWGTLGVIYAVWFIFHPTSITFLGIPVQDNATFFALIATVSTYYLADYLDDKYWDRLKKRFWVLERDESAEAKDSTTSVVADGASNAGKKATPSVNELQGKGFLELGRGWADVLMEQVRQELEIVKGSYDVATRLLAAAKKDFWCKNVNELAKTARSLAIFALFYLLLPTVGEANKLYPYLSPFRLVFLLLVPGFIFLYIWLKEKQRFMYYQVTLHLIEKEKSKFRKISGSLRFCVVKW